MRFLYRWLANALAFFFGLYLIDTLIAPHFYVRKLWIAILLALLMGAANSTNRPFRKYESNRRRAFGFFGLTALANYLFMQIISWLGAPLTGNLFAFMFAAVCLTLLAALMNYIVGFKPPDEPKVVTRERRVSDVTRERTVQPDRGPTKKRRWIRR